MLKKFKSKIKHLSSSQEKEKPMTSDSPQAQTEKYRRLEDRVDPNESVISAQSSFKGEISGQAGAHILGSFEGDVHSEGLVRAGKAAKIKGNIHSPYVILEGDLEGDICSARQVELQTKARMRGNIETEMLAIADGCFFEGQIRMAPPQAQPVRFTERRRPEED
ncbi:MAG TPA: polymer-forming cytoskeletal protein [Candidatus Desulfaltia sp.]|nr:polymer-forming cytoskeletal protein [Candidatus Desulfaltia sp.]